MFLGVANEDIESCRMSLFSVKKIKRLQEPLERMRPRFHIEIRLGGRKNR